MKRNLIIAGVVVLLVAGAVWHRHVKNARPATQAEQTDRDLKNEGVLHEDGTVTADPEFDAELNAMSRDLSGIDASASGDLDELETEE